VLFGKSALVGWLLLDATFGAVNLWRLFQPNERRVFGLRHVRNCRSVPRSASRATAERASEVQAPSTVDPATGCVAPGLTAVALRVSLPGTYDRPARRDEECR